MSRLERIDYGTTYKYFSNPSLTLGIPRHRQKFTEKQESTLLDFNPHRGALGLQAQDFTPSRLCASLQLAAAAAATTTAGADTADHQLLDSKTPAASTAFTVTANEDEDDNASADNAVGDDAAAAPPVDEPAANQPAQAAANGPDIQFVLDESSSGSESDDEAGSSEEGSSDRPEAQSSKPLAGPPSAAHQQQQQVLGQAQDQQQQQQQRRKRKRQSEEAVVVIHSSDGAGNSSSSSGSESDTEGDDDENELILVEDQQPSTAAAADDPSDSEDNFLPLLPSHKAADASDHHSDHDHDGTSTDQGRSVDRLPGYKPPWLPRLARFSSPMLRLHNEIVAFTKMLEPTPEEVDSRAQSMKVIREVVHSIWPKAEVLIFGSYETGLYTPASDTDVVVVNAGLNNPTTGLKALAHALTQRQLVRNMQQVLTARVPIIKFEMVASGLAFDVAWEQRSGPQGAAVVKNLLAQWPVMKPLVLVLKVFLTQRELNEVYSGGIGSYSLIIMVAAFLQLHESRRPKTSKSSKSGVGSKRGRSSSVGSVQVATAIEANLGLLLLDFFRLYGRALNLSEVGVTCSSEGCFYSKAAKGFTVHDRPWLLSVQDPLDPQNDTARNSWNIKLVRQVFDHAYQLLSAPCSPADSLLGRIIHLAPVISGRPTPAWIYQAPPRSQLGFSHRGDRSRSRGAQNPGKPHHPKTSPSAGYRESERGKGRREKSERSRSRGAGSSGKGGGSSSGRYDDRYRGSSKKQQKEGRDGRGSGGSSSKKRRSGNFGGGGDDRDAAGRAGAAAGGGRYQQQQQQQQYQQQQQGGSRQSPSRKRQRR